MGVVGNDSAERTRTPRTKVTRAAGGGGAAFRYKKRGAVSPRPAHVRGGRDNDGLSRSV